MKRRKFIKSLPVIALPAVLPGMSMHAITNSKILNMLPFIDTERIVVLIQFSGGCDGLNMVFPRDQYDNLANARSNIIIPESQILGLDGTDLTGLHPKMSEIQGMYNDGNVSIVQSVAYENQNYSHFRSTDIWMTGSDANETLNTGWAGRYLDYEYPGAPGDYPNSDMPDPLAIQIGNSVSQVFWGNQGILGYSLESAENFYELVDGIPSPAPDTYYGDELTYIREVADSANAYGQRIKDAWLAGQNLYSYPTGNKLADQLKIIARLIKGGMKTRLYMVSLSGFDNHSNQVDSSDRSSGAHPALLQKFSQAVSAFFEDQKLLHIEKRVLGMTFSEFGRRIKSNASLGTDHGRAAPVILFGDQLEGGVIGTSPQIPSNPGVNDNVVMQYDYRQVYSTLMRDWFCAEDPEMTAIFDDNWTTLGFVNPDVAGDCSYGPLPVKTFVLSAEAAQFDYHNLTWKMINSERVSQFVIQYSADGIAFRDIQTELAGGTLSGVEYRYDDAYLYKYPEGRQHYYRIKAVEETGSIKYSNIVSLATKGVDLSIYPNPAGDWVSIKLHDRDQTNTYTVALYNVSGQKALEQQITRSDFSAGIYRLNIANLWAGQYLVVIIDKYKERFQQKLTVVH
ncbi:MAG TPA: DUF1501 domain-containing protein [Saprospiraceae bacterium]|nr:DUF1501 domain-containing protein [Saprospiraceae bacterium]